MLLDKLQKASRIFSEQGIYGIKAKIADKLRNRREEKKYQEFVRRSRFTDSARGDIREEIKGLKLQPLISVLLPTYNTDEKWLRVCIESVLKQLYPNWELCIADDASTKQNVHELLNEYAASDKRIKIVVRETNGHISAASNSALELATGEFIAFLDHDDELSEDALFRIVSEVNEYPDVQLIYSDEDLIDKQGRRSRPRFKPDWSPDLFLSLNLLNHLVVFRTATVRRVGGFREGFEGSQDYDVELRVLEQIRASAVRHIPHILYHWRAIAGSVALAATEKTYAHERARIAIREHLERTGRRGDVTGGAYDLHRIRFHLPNELSKVSVIFSDDTHIENVSDLVSNTGYTNLELLIVGDRPESTYSPNVRYLRSDAETLADRLNFAAALAEGSFLCFADAGFRPLSPDWLREMVGWAMQDGIGAIGATLLYRNWTVMHGGLITGINDAVDIADRGIGREALGNMFRNRFPGNFSATSACFMVVRKAVFDAVGGFDAEHFPEHLFDADMCLRLRKTGYRIVVTPFAELMQIGNAVPRILKEKPTELERENFRKKWPDYMLSDPYYHPDLSKMKADSSIQV